MFKLSILSRLSSATLALLLTLIPLQAQSYSTISEEILKAYFESPLNLVPELSLPGSPKINLLKWNESLQDPPEPTEHYSRVHHFGEWITLNQDTQSCLDTRNRVLIRDSIQPIQMRPNNPCKVGTGAWYDPYTDTVFNNSTQVQIDHFVPLKDTYINGAWKWNYQTRCVYGNYMGFKDHLKPVSGRANMVKSDHSPVDYMPENEAYKCEYLKTWLSIKLIWRLGMQRSEAQTIRQLVKEGNCDTSQFTFSTADLQNQRSRIQSMLPICPTEAPSHNDR